MKIHLKVYVWKNHLSMYGSGLVIMKSYFVTITSHLKLSAGTTAANYVNLLFIHT